MRLTHGDAIGSATVVLQAKFDAMVGGEGAEFGDRLGDLVDGLLFGNALLDEQGVGEDADSQGPDVLGKKEIFLRALDVLAELGRVVPVVGEAAGQAELEAGVGDAAADGGPLGLRERHLHAVGVGRSQFHAARSRFPCSS